MSLLPLILGLIVFLGIHGLTMNRPSRSRLIKRVGVGPYKGLYSLASLVGLVLIIYGYGVYRNAGMIPVWSPPYWTRHITFLLVLIAFVFVPAAYAPTHIKATLKHPMITAVMLWSLGHLLVRGDLGSILMFGAFLLWGVVARISMAQRAPDDEQGPPLPMREPRWGAYAVAVGVGVFVYVLFLVWLHRLLIGVQLLPG
jgi:uncharacterized membrane protein